MGCLAVIIIIVFREYTLTLRLIRCVATGLAVQIGDAGQPTPLALRGAPFIFQLQHIPDAIETQYRSFWVHRLQAARQRQTLIGVRARGTEYRRRMALRQELGQASKRVPTLRRRTCGRIAMADLVDSAGVGIAR